MRKYSTLIFDFDGTLADTFSITVNIYNDLAENFNGKKVSRQEASDLRSHTLKEVIEILHIPVYRLPFYLIKGRNLFKKYIKEISVIEGIPRILRELRKEYRLAILSSNSVENIRQFLKKSDLEVFDFIHSEKNLFGKHNAIKHILNKYAFEAREVLYIGDEVRDIESCHKTGVDIAAVGWGYNSVDILESYHPTYLSDTPDDLGKLLL